MLITNTPDVLTESTVDVATYFYLLHEMHFGGKNVATGRVEGFSLTENLGVDVKEDSWDYRNGKNWSGLQNAHMSIWYESSLLQSFPG